MRSNTRDGLLKLFSSIPVFGGECSQGPLPKTYFRKQLSKPEAPKPQLHFARLTAKQSRHFRRPCPTKFALCSK